MNNTLEGIDSSITETEERINDLEVEITTTEQNIEKRMIRNEDSLRDLWNNIKHTNICIIAAPEGEWQPGFPGGSEVKASASNAGDLGSIPGSGRSSGEGNGNTLQHSCLENPMDGGAWWATVHGVTKSRTRLSDLTFNFQRQRKEKACENGTKENPRTRVRSTPVRQRSSTAEAQLSESSCGGS